MSAFNALIFCLCLAEPSAAGTQKLEAARLFGDNAVLQRDKPIPVWGRAAAGRKVTVRLADASRETEAGPDGRWRVDLPPLEAGGPHRLEIVSGNERLEFGNILIGEVWLCSGQSNMEWPVRLASNYEREKNDAELPSIRHFQVEREVEIAPRSDLGGGVWKVSSAETVGEFTAVGFFFAREIHRRLNVPVGLIHSSWGGSQIEGWISREGMIGSDVLGAYGRDLPVTWEEADAHLERNIKRNTLGDPEAKPTLADEKRYTAEGFDFTGWHKAGGMGQWDWQGIWAWRGNGYMARKVEIPAALTGRHTVLGLAEGYQRLEVHINGRRVFAGILRGKREIVVPPDTWREGSNSLVLKTDRMIEPEWFGLGFMGSAEDLYVAAGDTRIPLAGEWHLMPSFAEERSYARSSNNLGTIIYNAMIAPLVPYGIRGVLWYQGESNAGRAHEYRRTFPLLIRDWRRLWGEELPFYFVQLSSFGADRSSNVGSGWAELREAQAMALGLPRTGMAVTIDIGDPDDVHPRNKQDVGQRLAAIALNGTYGIEGIEHSGPVFESVSFGERRAVVSFRHVGKGLVARDRYGYLKGFEIAGSDRRFHYAKARIEGARVIVQHPSVAEPVAVRYAWSDAPVEANLFNEAGLPAAPFRTDQWEGITVGKRFR